MFLSGAAWASPTYFDVHPLGLRPRFAKKFCEGDGLLAQALNDDI